MTQHLFDTVLQGAPVRVVLGFERMLQELFLTVAHLNAPATGEQIYASFDDPDADRKSVEYFRRKLESLGIEVPEAMFLAMERELVAYLPYSTVMYTMESYPLAVTQNRKLGSEPLYLGEMTTEEGKFRVYRQFYSNWAVSIQLQDDAGIVRRTLSANIAVAIDLLGPNEFFVPTWGNNVFLNKAALASGLFEDTGRPGPLTEFLVRPQIWRICT